MRVVEDVVQVDGHRIVLHDPFVVYRGDLHRFGARFLGQQVRVDRVRPFEHFVDVRDVALVGHDLGHALRHRRADAAGVIAVVMRHQERRHRFVRPQLSGLGEHRQRSFLVRCFDQHEMIAEFREQTMVSRAGDKPEALRHFLHRDGRFRRWPGVGRWRGRGDVRGRRQVSDVAVNGLFQDAKVGTREPVGLRRHARWKPEPVDALILAEACLDGCIAQSGAVGHHHDAGRQPGRRVNRQRQGDVVGGDVDETLVPLSSDVRESRRRAERRANDRERMAEELDPPSVDGSRRKHARRVAVFRHVEHDISVEALYLARAALALVERVLQFARRLEPRAAVRQVVGTPIVSDLADIRLKTQLVITKRLADAHVVARALDEQCLDRQDPLATAERGRGIVDDLLFLALRTDGGLQEQEARHDRKTRKSTSPHGVSEDSAADHHSPPR